MAAGGRRIKITVGGGDAEEIVMVEIFPREVGAVEQMQVDDLVVPDNDIALGVDEPAQSAVQNEADYVADAAAGVADAVLVDHDYVPLGCDDDDDDEGYVSDFPQGENDSLPPYDLLDPADGDNFPPGCDVLPPHYEELFPQYAELHNVCVLSPPMEIEPVPNYYVEINRTYDDDASLYSSTLRPSDDDDDVAPVLTLNRDLPRIRTGDSPAAVSILPTEVLVDILDHICIFPERFRSLEEETRFLQHTAALYVENALQKN